MTLKHFMTYRRVIKSLYTAPTNLQCLKQNNLHILSRPILSVSCTAACQLPGYQLDSYSVMQELSAMVTIG